MDDINVIFSCQWKKVMGSSNRPKAPSVQYNILGLTINTAFYFSHPFSFYSLTFPIIPLITQSLSHHLSFMELETKDEHPFFFLPKKNDEQPPSTTRVYTVTLEVKKKKKT